MKSDLFSRFVSVLMIGACSIWAGLLVMVYSASAGGASIDSRRFYSHATLQFGDDWFMTLSVNGSATLTCGPADAVKVPEGTFEYEKWIADVRAAITAAPPTPDKNPAFEEWLAARRNAEMNITLWDHDEAAEKFIVAMFTPALKSYIDIILEMTMSQRLSSLTNQHSVFSENQMAAIARWTNSPGSQVLDVPQALSPLASEPPGSPSFQSKIGGSTQRGSSGPQSENGVESINSLRPVPATNDTKDPPLGFRGWLVVGLLGIAAFLTYRFVRLRLGS